MKKIYIYLLAALTAVFVSTSCSAGWLDLEPGDEAPRGDALKNMDDAEVAMYGVYQMIKGTNNYPNYYAAAMIYYGDVRGDDMQVFAKSSNRATWAYNMTYTISGANNMWQTPYIVIDRANSLIEAFEKGMIKDGTTEEHNHLIGQCLMARALAHFDLLRVYSLPYDVPSNGGKYGVPVVTKVLSYEDKPGRNTINDVYTQVIADLKDAINKMYPDYAIGEFNSWAAKALLARVYLYQGDNDSAYKLAYDVIENGPSKLWTNEQYIDAWSIVPNKASDTEVLFEISITNTSDWTDRPGIAYLYSQNGYREAHITKSFNQKLKTEKAGDVRLGIFLKTTNAQALGGMPKPGEPGSDIRDENIWVNKYPGSKTATDFRIGNIPLLRLSETYLIAAEAAVKGATGTTASDAAKYLNAIILRGNPNATPLSAGSITLDDVLNERRFELTGEGHRFFDLIRNNKTVVRYERGATEAETEQNRGWHLPLSNASREFDNTYFRVILPIPLAEIEANPTIASQQNPGY